LRKSSKYIDHKKLSDILVQVIELIDTIRTLEHKNDFEKFGKQFQELLFNISLFLFHDQEQLVQMDEKKFHREISAANTASRIFALHKWMENNDLQINLEDLLEKLSQENPGDLSAGDIEKFKTVFFDLVSQLYDRSIVNKMYSLLSTDTSIKILLNDKETVEKLVSMLQHTRKGEKETFDERVLEFMQKIEEKLVLVPSVLFHIDGELLTDPEVFGKWLAKNGPDFDTLKQRDVAQCIIEVLVRGWHLVSLYQKNRTFKKEPFAVKSSIMLASAHLLYTNLTTAISPFLKGVPSAKYKLDLFSLGLGAKYALRAVQQYAKREKKIQQDFTDKINGIYKNSLKLL